MLKSALPSERTEGEESRVLTTATWWAIRKAYSEKTLSTTQPLQAKLQPQKFKMLAGK